jgi:transposase
MGYVTLQYWVPKYGSEELLSMKKPAFTDSQRNSIVNSILNGRMTVKEASLQNDVKQNTIKEWIRKKREDNPDIEVNQSGMPTSDENELQKALRASQLKVLALETLIDVAEQEFKIKIRKKPGAKQ